MKSPSRGDLIFLISYQIDANRWGSGREFFRSRQEANAAKRSWLREHPADAGSIRVTMDEYAPEIYGSN